MRCEDEKKMRCEDEKMFYRPLLLEEPCAQTLSGKTLNERDNSIRIKIIKQHAPMEWLYTSTAF
jgi:hypothetical protein